MKTNVLEPPEPKGKLDAETVNGPELRHEALLCVGWR